MYVPRRFAVADPDEVLALIRAASFGHLVSTSDDGTLTSTALPFVVDDDLTEVRAHVARANPHWRSLDGRPSLLIVPVADTYVSPRWYPSKAEHGKVVPTWNYEVVHLQGTVTVQDDPAWTRRMVGDLTAHNEAGVADARPAWRVDDAPADFVDAQLRAIVGLGLAVERVEAARKLSQNRSDADRAGVLEALAASPDQRDRDIAAAMGTD